MKYLALKAIDKAGKGTFRVDLSNLGRLESENLTQLVQSLTLLSKIMLEYSDVSVQTGENACMSPESNK